MRKFKRRGGRFWILKADVSGAMKCAAEYLFKLSGAYKRQIRPMI
ncbi:hypothetical protein CAMRE0001_2843 [Campylobacter rectus RM3267]|uniref:Uncharacterized protein n=1 Tax=Campylobacter rectus RM3267 TaxID=553218 RepID=B9D132_CAMRE|nr:hypothetical protein CAMRE0001_2843 [Campylobacter rectus RM3267]